MRGRAWWGGTERIAFTVWLAASAGACTSWQTQEVSPEQLVTERHPEAIRVTLSDSSRLEVISPVMVGDTVVGMTPSAPAGPRLNGNAGAFGLGAASPEDTGARVRIPSSELIRVQTNHIDGGKTALLVVGIAAVVGGMLAIAASSMDNMSIDFGCGY